VIFSRPLIFTSALFCLLAPAELRAADVTPLAAVSFAYRHRHPVTAIPASAIGKVSRVGDDIGDEATLNAPFEPPAEIGVAPARKLTRGDVCNAIVSAARANDLPVSFFANLIWQESNFDSVSISPAGAQGIAQFMPRTAFESGLMNPFEPIHALFTAGELLRKLNGQFGNLGLAAAAYNAGPKRVNDWLGRRGELPGETRSYVRKITGRPAVQWTSSEFTHGPEAALMPARAPCYAVVEEVEAQAQVVRVAHLMSDLAAAAAPPRTEPGAQPFNEVAWAAATAKPDWRQWAVTMVRDVVKRVRDKETRVAASGRAVKAVSRAWSKVAARTMQKATAEFAKLDAPAKIQDRVTAHAGGPARRAHVASAR
jgi:hypothetical protein